MKFECEEYDEKHCNALILWFRANQGRICRYLYWSTWVYTH